MSHASTTHRSLLVAPLSPTLGAGANHADTVPLSDSLLRLPGCQWLANRLGANEFRRRLLHMSPGLLPIALWFAPHTDPWGGLLIGVTVCLFAMTVVMAIVHGHVFARPGEEAWSFSVLGYVLPIAAMLLCLPGHAELGLMTLGIVALGDGSAAMGGLTFGGRRLPWNHRKTWTGVFAFLGVAGTMSTLFYWMEARPGVSLSVAILIAGTATLVGAIVESLPIKSHDNLRVGLSAALTGIVMQTLTVGW